MWFRPQVPGADLVSVHRVLKGTTCASFRTLVENPMNKMSQPDILALKKKKKIAD